MTVFGKCVAFGCALLIAAFVSAFLLFPQQGLAPSNATSQLPQPRNAGATAAIAPAPPSEAALPYTAAYFDASGDIAEPGHGGAAVLAFASPTPAGVIPAALTTGIAPGSTTSIPIMMYHYVRVVTNPRDILGQRLSVTPAQFAQQMQYLADHGYTTLTMRDVYSILSGDEPRPAKPIALTFDDGYRDFYTNAWPVLKEHNFKATSYIITGFVGGSAYMTWDQIRELDATAMVDFGAHTEHHVDLRYLNATTLWNEIDGSKVALEKQLGHSVLDFCYPSGEYNARIIADVEKAGFDTATTTHYGYRQNLNWNLALPRVRVTGPNGFRSWVASLPD